MGRTALVLMLTVLYLKPIGAVTSGADMSTAPGRDVVPERPMLLPAVLDPDSQEILSKVQAAYANIASLECTGTLIIDSEIAGRVEQSNKPFYTAYHIPNKFRYELGRELVTGCTGSDAYLHQVTRNQYTTTAEHPKGDQATLVIPSAIVQILETNNPLLLALLNRQPSSIWEKWAHSFHRNDDVRIDSKLCYCLGMELRQQAGFGQLYIDCQSFLIRRVVFDRKTGYERSGMIGVKKALFEIDYAKIRSGYPFATSAFQWSPPSEAKCVGEQTVLQSLIKAP